MVLPDFKYGTAPKVEVLYWVGPRTNRRRREVDKKCCVGSDHGRADGEGRSTRFLYATLQSRGPETTQGQESNRRTLQHRKERCK